MLIYFQKYSKYPEIFYQQKVLTTCMIIAQSCVLALITKQKVLVREKSHKNIKTYGMPQSEKT